MSNDKRSTKHTFTTREIEEIRKEAHAEGLNQGRKEILDWLENAYINDPGRPDRNSPKGKAILELAADAAEHFRPMVNGKRVRGGRHR